MPYAPKDLAALYPVRPLPLAVLAIACGLLSASTSPAGTHYDLYLLAGQSNMDGRGKAANLDPQQRQPSTSAIIFYRNPPAASDGWQSLAPGYSIPPGYKGKVPSGTFGPELGFAAGMLEARKDRPLALIKGSKGGTSLARDWNPGSKDDPNSQGPCYRNFIETVALACKELERRGDTYEMRGVLWHQGESDANSPAEKYQRELTSLVRRLREDLGKPDLPVVIGEVFDNGKRDAVRTAQKAAAKSIPHTAFAPAGGLKTWDHGTHFDAASQLTLGRRFAEAMLQLESRIDPAGKPTGS